MDTSKLKVGDRIEFKASTRSDYKKAIRVITEIDTRGRICIRYHGYNDFMLYPSEVIRKVDDAPCTHDGYITFDRNSYPYDVDRGPYCPSCDDLVEL